MASWVGPAVTRTFFPGNHRDDVGIHAEARAGLLEIVGADHVHILFFQLFPAVFHHVLGLHGEAADDLSRFPVLAQVFEDVRGAF